MENETSTAKSRGDLATLKVSETTAYVSDGVNKGMRARRQASVDIEFTETQGWSLYQQSQRTGYTDRAGLIALLAEFVSGLCAGCGRSLRRVEAERCSDCLAKLQSEDLALETSLEARREGANGS